MHPNTPTEPTAGEPILPWAQELTRAVRALTPTSSPDIRVQVTPAGTSYHMARDMRSRGQSAVVDADGYDVAKNPVGRMTIEQNREDYSDDPDTHETERQLRNVQYVQQQSSSVPFFVSSTLQGTVPDKIVGELYWAQLDAKRYDDSSAASYKSLDATNDYSDTTKGKWNLGLYAFPSSESCSAPYSIHATHGGHTDKTLTWQVPVMIEGSARPTTPATADVITYMNAGSATGHYATLTNAKRTLTVDKGTLAIGSVAAETNCYVPVTLDATIMSASIDHRLLCWSNGALPSWSSFNTDHDARYLCQGHTGLGKWTERNCAESIANNSYGKFGIDFANGQLLNEAGSAYSVDYSARKLKDTGGTVTIDWNVGALYKPSNYAGWLVSSPLNVDGAFTSFEGTSRAEVKTTGVVIKGPYVRTSTFVGEDEKKLIYAQTDGSTPVVYVNNLRLMIGDDTTNWIGFEAIAGQLRIVTQAGVELAKFTVGEP